MPNITLPEGWVYFATIDDALFAASGLLLVALLIIWWRQQINQWFRLVTSLLLAALLFCISSYYLFVVPPYYVGCPEGCQGRRGYPLPIATLDFNDDSLVAPIDFALNLLMLWLLLLGASLICRILGLAFAWSSRSFRLKLLFVAFVLLPWAILPRILNPPQPVITGEELRLATNARRAAEFTYAITGLWVHRLAIEDIRPAVSIEDAALDTALGDDGETPSRLVCLRGYTWFYLPWRKYRIELEPSGVTALSLTERSIRGSCWDER